MCYARHMTTKRKATKTQPKLWIENNSIFMQTPYSRNIFMESVELPGRVWDREANANVFPLTSVTHIIAFAERWGVPISDEIKALPPSPDKTHYPNVLSRDGKMLRLKFLYNPEFVDSVKKDIPAARWNPSEKQWEVSAEFSAEAIAFAQKFDFHIEQGLSEEVDKIIAARERAYELSSAVDADVELDGVSLSLLPYQKAGVAYLQQARRAILGDQPGLGKTLQALTTVVAERAFPAVVVCPNTLKLNWRNEVKKFYPDLTVNVVSGRATEELPYADITVINYDIIYDRVPDLLALKPMALIADESHAIKNGKATHTCPTCNAKVRSNAKNCSACNTKNITPVRNWTVKRAGGVLMLAESIPQEGMVLLLTGTPITNRPIELVPQLEAIGALKHFGGRWKFEGRYCPNGKGAAFMEELNRKMRSSCYIRRKKQDVYGELPDVRNAVQILNIPAKAYKEYSDIEQDVVNFLAEKAREIAREEGRNPDAAYFEKYNQLKFNEQLVKLTVLRDAVSKMKYNAITDWLDEFLANGEEKVVVFAEHIEFVENIAAKYADITVKVRGGVSNDDRMAAVDKFQNDPTCRIFVANMKAASEGLTLTAASDVVFCELAWTPSMHEQCVGRCYGRVNDLHGATAWYLLAEKTIDEDIFELLEEKRKIVDAVTDGVDPIANNNVMIDLLKKLTERGLNG